LVNCMPQQAAGMRLWRIVREMHYAVTRLTELRLAGHAGPIARPLAG
jgi:hypothetical protein